MEYVLICQSLFVWINRSDELSVWWIKCSWLYSEIMIFQSVKFTMSVGQKDWLL